MVHGVARRRAGLLRGFDGYATAVHVLVGGPPASGKTTVAAALSAELGVALLRKDDVKEALMDALGAPADLAASRRLGRAAVHVVLRVAKGLPDAVIDSTWFAYTRPLVAELPRPIVEVRCELPEREALRRFTARAAARDPRHLDLLRDRAELRDPELLQPLGVGAIVHVDTAAAVDAAALARAVRAAATSRGTR